MPSSVDFGAPPLARISLPAGWELMSNSLDRLDSHLPLERLAVFRLEPDRCGYPGPRISLGKAERCDSSSSLSECLSEFVPSSLEPAPTFLKIHGSDAAEFVQRGEAHHFTTHGGMTSNFIWHTYLVAATGGFVRCKLDTDSEATYAEHLAVYRQLCLSIEIY